MFVLGIGGSNHDFSASVVKNGELIIAIEDERLDRIKHGNQHWAYEPCHSSIKYCLSALNLDMEDIAIIVSNNDMDGKEFITGDKIIKIPHHLCHAASSFFTSIYTESALLVADGFGSLLDYDSKSVSVETISIGFAQKDSIELDYLQTGYKPMSATTWKYECSNSLGHFYKIITESIGFGKFDQGKTMGLAPFGEDIFYREIRSFVNIDGDGKFEFDPYGGIAPWIENKLNENQNEFQVKANIAYAGQKILEEAIIQIANECYKRTKTKYLCYAGGIALNCSANTKLRTSTPFEDIFIFPAAGDNGLSVGAAFYGYYCIKKNKRKYKRNKVTSSLTYKGKKYTKKEYQSALKNHPFYYSELKHPAKIIAELLNDRHVVTISQGQSEIGPRALGNRSILADPRSIRIRDHINLNIKKRESFRPLAPVVTAESASKYFEIDRSQPFMLEVSFVKEEYRKRLSGICHVDGSARLQTIERETNSLLYDVLIEFEKLANYPVLINTSFNGRGEPIVESPDDALKCFRKLKIDYLLVGNYLVEKHTPWAFRADIR
jgi:carbamoyltransferase